MTVHVVPLESTEGSTMRAHFSAIVPSPCPDLTGLCAAGEDCLVHPTSFPSNGTKPDPGWCVRQWQKTVPSNYKALIKLGSNEYYITMNAEPKVRANNGKLNQPVFVALPPPIRVRVNCPHHVHLSVKDLDGDKVKCRFARADQGECASCDQHSFIELDEDKCMVTFTGKATVGQYFIHLMVEDRIPIPKTKQVTANDPLSSVPVLLSVTVEESTISCIAEPLATGETPDEDTTMSVLPYQEVKFNTKFTSEEEGALEIVVVGPPDLYKVGFKTDGPLAMMTMAWVRSENKLARLLPICFVVNTKSLQSEPRCLWLKQREMRALPAGTELKCEGTAMSLHLPVSSLADINLAELQLNSPTCPVSYNSTHLSAKISFSDCGTKIVHSGSELVYTNTLQTVRPYSMVSRRPSLVLPLACRFTALQAKGPHYNIIMPTERETFGELNIWIEVHFPGEGPLSNFTRSPTFRTLGSSSNRLRREAESPAQAPSNFSESAALRAALGSKVKQLDLHLMSNCSIARAEMIVGDCIESETQDFKVSHPILTQGCTSSKNTVEVVTTRSNSRVYRIDMADMKSQGTTMYIRCTVNLCIATLPSQKCPDLCNRALTQGSVVSSVYTRTYTVSSGAVSLVVTTPAPKTTATTRTTTTTGSTASTTTTSGVTITTATTGQTTTSHAPEQTSSMAAGVILTTISIFLQNVFLY
ncbi:uncharacterized protein V6R79_009556 [Siganus canaliculatus]